MWKPQNLNWKETTMQHTVVDADRFVGNIYWKLLKATTLPSLLIRLLLI